MSFLETGKFGALPSSHPYMTIATELQNFANSSYPGIRPANPDNARPLLTPRERRTWDDMRAIVALLESYKSAKGSYPTTSEGLAALAPLGSVPKTDAWGTAFAYTCPGTLAEYELASYGADAKPGGDGEDADITSWAEANLVARWYEYTPTSALDVAFGDVAPSA